MKEYRKYLKESLLNDKSVRYWSCFTACIEKYNLTVDSNLNTFRKDYGYGADLLKTGGADVVIICESQKR